MPGYQEHFEANAHLIYAHVIFIFWRYLKAEVFKCRPRNLLDLKQSVHKNIQHIPQELERQYAFAAVLWQSRSPLGQYVV